MHGAYGSELVTCRTLCCHRLARTSTPGYPGTIRPPAYATNPTSDLPTRLTRYAYEIRREMIRTAHDLVVSPRDSYVVAVEESRDSVCACHLCGVRR